MTLGRYPPHLRILQREVWPLSPLSFFLESRNKQHQEVQRSLRWGERGFS